MNWWDIPWWNRQNQHAWWFWCDPYGEMRVTDPKHHSRYIYTRPSDSHQKVLREAGWVYSAGNPEYWWTDNISVASQTCEALGLSLPVWDKNYCYRVYWHEAMYSI